MEVVHPIPIDVQPDPPSCTKPLTTYWLTRVIILRALALVHCASFFSHLMQLPALIGPDGLLPVHVYLSRFSNDASDHPLAFASLNLFALFPPDWLATTHLPFLAVPLLGFVAALFVLFRGAANVPLLLFIWLCHRSVHLVGQIFFGYGWELQLSETTFLALFLVPFFNLDPLPTLSTPLSSTTSLSSTTFTQPPALRVLASQPPLIVLWLFRFLLARIMLGAGLIKLRGDPCWRDLTCMQFHYLSQPVPSPLSWYFHHTPPSFHAFEVLINHAVELGFPFLLLFPFSNTIRRLAGLLQLAFQGLLILSGNLSFLNWLTIVPALACFDDRCCLPLFSPATRQLVALSAAHEAPRRQDPCRRWFSSLFSWRWPHPLASILLLFGVLYLSTFPIANMLSPNQAMNASFDRYHLVNTYGAFGSVGKERYEIIMFGQDASANSSESGWREYEFKCKPGRLDRMPCLNGPYHLRVDWQIWFAAMQNYQQNPWLISLVIRLLQGTPHAPTYLAHNPFPDQPPQRIKLDLYRYHFSEEISSPVWWTREFVHAYLPVALSLDHPAIPSLIEQLYHEKKNSI